MILPHSEILTKCNDVFVSLSISPEQVRSIEMATREQVVKHGILIEVDV